jgi:hypothetical protein
LRDEKYPIADYPKMYEYRNVYERLRKKVIRTYRVIPPLDYSIVRRVEFNDTLCVSMIDGSNITIITSPPYMRSLTYARDNRLRLWFLGYKNWEAIDKDISVSKNEFLSMMKQCFSNWSSIQKADSFCVVIVGDIVFDKTSKQSLPELVCKLACDSGYALYGLCDDPINANRKVVKGETKVKSEKICIFRRR